MRFLFVATATFFVFSAPLSASPVVSSEAAEDLRIQAIADKADRLHGQSDYLYEDEDSFVDATTGVNKREDCAQAPVRMKRTDGVVIVKRMDVCD
jgi:hypothetical protein